MLIISLHALAMHYFACITAIYLSRHTSGLILFIIVATVLGLTVVALVRSGRTRR